MPTRLNIASPSPWEALVGYSRAVRAGNVVYVSGTTGTDAKGRPVASDAHGQAVGALAKIAEALESAGASVNDVVRTRIYVTKVADWPAVGKAHAEIFGSVRPASTLVEVSNLIGDGILVEIEAEAVVTGAER